MFLIFGKYISVDNYVNNKSYNKFMQSLNIIFSDLEYTFLLKLIFGDSLLSKILLNLIKTYNKT